ncbi:MAG: dihydrolipoyl dehydrogenase, partial [Dehalococcoidales bacterium]|nr:dihydrolipoyl dehydrogenase [Dehalococcoidales bacterium]
LNRACIPTKFLLRSVEIYQLIKDSTRYGVSVAETGIDMAEVQSRKSKMVSTLKTGLAGVIEMNGIEVVKGCARLTPEKSIEITDERGNKRNIGAEKVILATGSRAVNLNIPGADSPEVLFADDILNLNYVPESMIIIGGGMVGVEMATILAKMDCRVSLIEMMPHILPNEDAEITVVLEGALKRDGVRIYTGSVVTRIDADDKNKKVVISARNVEKSLEAESIAIAAGYESYIDGLCLDECSIATVDGCIRVNEYMQTSVADIYAVGDVTGGMMLAYVAMAEGRVAAENALGGHSKIDYQAVPRCIFTLPEVASVGLTEDEAKAQGCKVKSGRFPFAANSAANILGERRGMVKIVADEENSKVLGVHIIGAGAVNLISEATLAIKLGATLDDIKNTLHAHPTLSEAFWEAALDASGETIHLKN